MRIKTLPIVLFVSTLSLAVASADEHNGSPGEGSSRFQPKPLDDEWSKWLVGEWVVTGTSDAGTAHGLVRIRLGVNGQFLISEGEFRATDVTAEQRQYIKENMGASDEEIEKYQQLPFTSLEVQTIDPRTGERVWYLFDSMRCIVVGKGRREGNKEIMTCQWFATARGATSTRIVERINDDKALVTVKYKLPNGAAMEDNIEMTRRR